MSAATPRDTRQARIEQLKRLRESLSVNLGDDARKPLADERLLTIDEACEGLQINKRTFYRRIETIGGLTPVLIDGRSYVVYDELIEWVRSYDARQRAIVDRALKSGRQPKSESAA